MAECEHQQFAAQVAVQRLSTEEGGPIDGFLAEVRVSCAECGQRFRFVGLPKGLDLKGATVSFDCETAHLAISPDGLPSTSHVRGFRITDRSGRG